MLVIVTDGNSGDVEWVGRGAKLVADNGGDEAVSEAIAAIEAGAHFAFVGFSQIRPFNVDNGKEGDARVALDQEEDGTFFLHTNGSPVRLYEGDTDFLDLMEAEDLRADVDRALSLIVAHGDDFDREAAGWALDQIDQ